MHGKDEVRFSDMFSETIRTHGFSYAYKHYVVRGKMSVWEWLWWCRNYA